MKRFNNLEHLRSAFVVKKAVSLNETAFIVDNESYEFSGEYAPTLHESIVNGDKPFLIYANKSNDALVFIWALNENNCFVPFDVRIVPNLIVEDKTEISDDLILADKVPVKFLDFPSAENVVAKVDTGAEVTSFHAVDIDIQRRPNKESTVTFTAPHLGSNNRITMPMITQSPVKLSNGHTTNRPVIKMTIEVQGKVLQDLLVNLNDRSEMDDPMLLGQNALEMGRFVVDPNKIKERGVATLATEADEFIENLRNEEVITESNDHHIPPEVVAEAIDKIKSFSFDDILKLLRTDIANRYNDIEY